MGEDQSHHESPDSGSRLAVDSSTRLASMSRDDLTRREALRRPSSTVPYRGTRGNMVRKVRAVLLAAAVVAITSQFGCIWIVAGVVGTGIGNAIRGEKFLTNDDHPHEEWLLPDGGKPVRTPDTKKADGPRTPGRSRPSNPTPTRTPRGFQDTAAAASGRQLARTSALSSNSIARCSLARRPALRDLASGGLGVARSPWMSRSARSAAVACASSGSSASESPRDASSRTWARQPTRHARACAELNARPGRRRGD